MKTENGKIVEATREELSKECLPLHFEKDSYSFQRYLRNMECAGTVVLCCGNCALFTDEDVEGKGLCEYEGVKSCDEYCNRHKSKR